MAWIQDDRTAMVPTSAGRRDHLSFENSESLTLHEQTENIDLFPALHVPFEFVRDIEGGRHRLPERFFSICAIN
jgi:hypothetical protein